MSQRDNIDQDVRRAEDNISGYKDGVSYCIYNQEKDTEWIRSTVSVEQERDNDGYSHLSVNNWK